MAKAQGIEERLNELEEITSGDLADLQPKTNREYFLVMWPTQQKILEHLEDINGFRKTTSTRLDTLEAVWKVGFTLGGMAIVGIAVKIIFGT